jgi:hypothetical protein
MNSPIKITTHDWFDILGNSKNANEIVHRLNDFFNPSRPRVVYTVPPFTGVTARVPKGMEIEYYDPETER